MDALALRKKAERFYDAGQLDSTLFYAGEAAGQAEHSGDWHTWGEAQTYILAARCGLNQYAATAAGFPALEQKAQAVLPGDSTFWSDYYNIAGVIFNEMGNYEEALKYGLQEISFYEKRGNKANLALANNNVGTYYLRRGDYDRALEYTQSALQAYASLPDTDPENKVWTYDNLCKIWYRKGDYANAIAYAEKGLAILKTRCPDRYDYQINLYLDLANAYSGLKMYEKALRYLREALQIQRTHKVSEGQADTWANLGFVYGMTSHYAEATEYLERARDAFGPKHPDFGRICLHLGLVHQLRGDLRAALQWQQKALEVLSNTTAGPDILANPGIHSVNAYYDFMYALEKKGETLRLLAQLESKPALLEAALATFDLATEVLDSMRTVYQEDSKQFWSQEARPLLEKAIALALEMRQSTGDDRFLAQAFKYAEKGKAYLLAEALRESAAKQKAGVPEPLLAQEKQIKIDIAFYKKQIFQEQRKSPADTARILLWQSEILQRRRSYETLLADLEKDYPEYYRIKYKQTTLDIAGLQQALPDNTALLEYFRGDSAIYVFYIDRKHATAASCPSDSGMVRLLEGVRDKNRVSEQGRSAAAVNAFAKNASALYRALIAPVIDAIPEQLILIPDGQLAYLPFELLLTGDAGDAAALSYADLPYLLRKTTIRYEYSANLAVQKYAAGHPVRFFDGYAPTYDQGLPSGALRDGPVDCQEWQATDFASLSNNRQEVAGVADMIGGISVLGPQATEAYFRQHAREPRILHLAMHGVLNDCDPAYSGLVFTPVYKNPGPDSGPEEADGILHAYEVYNLNLNAELAVLSACNTGRGKLAKGEGIMSLARAFKYAGCPNVLMSLWQADDMATADIMQGFYKYLKQGLGKAAAIRQAKLDYLAAAPRNHPFFWAGFVLIGDDAPLQQSSAWPWYIIGFILLFAGLFWAFRQRKKIIATFH